MGILGSNRNVSAKEKRALATTIWRELRKIHDFKVIAPKREGDCYVIELQFKAGGQMNLERYYVEVKGASMGDISCGGPHVGMCNEIRDAAVEVMRSAARDAEYLEKMKR